VGAESVGLSFEGICYKEMQRNRDRAVSGKGSREVGRDCFGWREIRMFLLFAEVKIA
jgi:hypothetical protein